MSDISSDFKPNKEDARLAKKRIGLEATPEAIKEFWRSHRALSDYGYWYLLSTLWVSYTGWSDLEKWKALFSSSRGRRQTSIMKPSEQAMFNALRDVVTVFRAHRPGEQDWIAYTMSMEKAKDFAWKRRSEVIGRYEVSKSDILAVFLRRGEWEVIVLDKGKVRLQQEYDVEYPDEKSGE